MKKFNKYILSKNDKQIIKNFKLDENYKVLNQEEIDEYWTKILNINNKNILKELYNKLRWMNGYIAIIDNKEYFIYDYYEKNFYNIFFYNITENKEIELSTNKEHIDLFRVLCSIIIRDIKINKSLSYKIKLPSKNTKLYFKLIDKVVKLVKKKFIIKKIKGEYFYYRYVNSDNLNTTLNTKRQLIEKYMYSGLINRIMILNVMKTKS